SPEELETHLRVARYGDFSLTDAIRPSYDLKVIPCQGFRHEFYRDEESNATVPVLMASATKERVLETFMDLLDPLGNVVDVVLETSHSDQSFQNQDLYREHIDIPVLKSILWDFEDLLTNDGCTGIAVMNPRVPSEVQFDEHKLLIVYGNQLEAYEETLTYNGIPCDEEMKFITEAEHVHSSCERYVKEFGDLVRELGIDAYNAFA
ncbi:MAG: hypothetical protein KDA99_11925, partial [Planctomycetales bacterium]|nr:hypothetical protein [Planctomycetales bacterium]